MSLVIFLFSFSLAQAMRTLKEYQKELKRINSRIEQEGKPKVQKKETTKEKDKDKKLIRKQQKEKKIAQEWAQELPNYIASIQDVGWHTNTKYECGFDENNHANIQSIINQMKFNTGNTIPLKYDSAFQSLSICSNGTFWATYLVRHKRRERKQRQYKYTICFQRPDMFLQLFLAIHEKYEQQEKE